MENQDNWAYNRLVLLLIGLRHPEVSGVFLFFLSETKEQLETETIITPWILEDAKIALCQVQPIQEQRCVRV